MLVSTTPNVIWEVACVAISRSSGLLETNIIGIAAESPAIVDIPSVDIPSNFKIFVSVNYIDGNNTI